MALDAARLAARQAISAALAAPTYQNIILQRALFHENSMPKDEFPFYGGTAADLLTKFPPEKGFVVNPQFRLGPLPNNDNERTTIDMLGTACKHPAKSGFLVPDALVTYIPFRCIDQQPPPGKHHLNLPVLLEEVKPFLPENHDAAMLRLSIYDGIMADYLERLNHSAVYRGLAVYDAQGMLAPCDGVLVCGTRCFRYKVTISQEGDVLAQRMDGLDTVLKYYVPGNELNNWIGDIRARFEAFNPAGVLDNQRFPAWLLYDLGALPDKVDYEAYLHGYIYTALATRWSLSDGFIVKPQAAIYDGPRMIDVINGNLAHARVNSYADYVRDSEAKYPDFLVAFYNGSHDTAVVVVEAKSGDAQDAQERIQARTQLRKYMRWMFTSSGTKVPGLAILGKKCWRVGWKHEPGKKDPEPATDEMYHVVGEPLASSLDDGNNFQLWTTLDAEWDAIKTQRFLA